ncbi:polynucleotide adenylyltransferase PcnB, partial [Pseudomonas sp. GW247-3R2A]
YQDANDSERRDMIRDLSGKDEGTGAPRKRRRSGGAKRKRAAGAPSATGE